MHRIDGPTRSAVLPAPNPVGTGNSSPGYFGRGDAVQGIPPTTLDVDWANMVQEEMAAVVEGAGIALDKTNRHQLFGALQALFVAKGGGSDFYLGPTGEFSIPLGGGFILKGGTINAALSERTVNIPFHTPFPNACLIGLPILVNASARTDRDVWAQRVSLSAGSFVAMVQWTGDNNNSADGIDWLAVGY